MFRSYKAKLQEESLISERVRTLERHVEGLEKRYIALMEGVTALQSRCEMPIFDKEGNFVESISANNLIKLLFEKLKMSVVYNRAEIKLEKEEQ